MAQNKLTNVLFMKCETEADLKEVKALHAHCKTIKQNKFVVPALKRVISHPRGSTVRTSYSTPK